MLQRPTAGLQAFHLQRQRVTRITGLPPGITRFFQCKLHLPPFLTQGAASRLQRLQGSLQTGCFFAQTGQFANAGLGSLAGFPGLSGQFLQPILGLRQLPLSPLDASAQLGQFAVSGVQLPGEFAVALFKLLLLLLGVALGGFEFRDSGLQLLVFPPQFVESTLAHQHAVIRLSTPGHLYPVGSQPDPLRRHD